MVKQISPVPIHQEKKRISSVMERENHNTVLLESQERAPQYCWKCWDHCTWPPRASAELLEAPSITETTFM